MRTTISKTICIWKLGKELSSAGISHNGMSLFGNILEILLVDEIQSSQAQVIIDAHDSIDTITIRRNDARVTSASIPNWATWTQTDWANYYNANISATEINKIADLAGAKAMLNKMSTVINNLAKMEIALRDWDWPDL